MSRVSGRVSQDRKMSKKGRDYKPRGERGETKLRYFILTTSPVTVCRAISTHMTFQIHISKCHFHLIRATFQKIHFSNWITRIENTFLSISNNVQSRILRGFCLRTYWNNIVGWAWYIYTAVCKYWFNENLRVYVISSYIMEKASQKYKIDLESELYIFKF